MQPDHTDMDSQQTPSPLSPLPLFGDHQTEVPKEFMDYIRHMQPHPPIPFGLGVAGWGFCKELRLIKPIASPRQSSGSIVMGLDP